jgi:hypothetical protein
LKGIGKICQSDRAVYDIDLVAADFARIEGHASSGDTCSNQEMSARDSLRRGARKNGHTT